MDNIERAEQWKINSGINMFIGAGTTKEELEKEWQDFEASTTPEQQLISDDESIRIFGLTNRERYTQCMQNANNKSLSEDTVEMDFDTKIELAKQYMIDNNTIIMYPTDDKDELNSMWNKMNSEVPHDTIKKNDSKVIELFGLSNIDLYHYCLSKIEKREQDEDYIWRKHEEYISDTVNNETIIKEYMPMAAANPVIGIGPMPIYLPYENKASDKIYTKNKEKIDYYNTIFHRAYSGEIISNLDSVQKDWFTDIKELQEQYHQTGDEEISETIYALGWHPEYDISQVDNWSKVNKAVLDRIAEEYNYSNTEIIDISELADLLDVESKPDHREPLEHVKDLNPIYIVLRGLKGDKLRNELIKLYTGGPYTHATIGLSYKLDTLYSYNNVTNDPEHRGLSIEGLNFFGKNDSIYVFCVFVTDKDYSVFKSNLNYYLKNKDKTHYSVPNIISIVIKKPLNYEFDMICSQFVDRLLKFISVDITGKDSSLVSPNDLWRACMTHKKIYKLYSGLIKDYKPEKIKKAVNKLIMNSKTGTFKELAELLEKDGALLLPAKVTRTTDNEKNRYNKNISVPGKSMVTGSDVNDVVAKHSIEKTEDDIAAYKKMLEIQDPQELVNEYNTWINCELNNMLANRKTAKSDEYAEENFASMIILDIHILKNTFNATDKQIKEIVTEDYFEKSDDPEKIKRILRIRLNYANKMISIFERMIKTNYALLELDEYNASQLLDLINSGDISDEYKAVEKVKKQIDMNPEKFQIKDGVYDIGKLVDNAGIICIAPRAMKINDKRNTQLSRLIQLSFEWDVVVVAHGNTDPNIKGINTYYESLRHLINTLNKRTYRDSVVDFFDDYKSDLTRNLYGKDEEIKKAKNTIDQIEDMLCDNFDIECNYDGIYTIKSDKYDCAKRMYEALISGKPKTADDIRKILNKASTKETKIIEQLIRNECNETIPNCFERIIDYVCDKFVYNFMMTTYKMMTLDLYSSTQEDWVWTTQPIYTPKGGPFYNINDLLRQLVFKEGYKKILLYNCNPGQHDIPEDIKKARVVIKYATTTTIAESNQIMNSINAYEDNLIRFCNINGIDYNNDQYLYECYTNLKDNIEIFNEKLSDDKTTWQELESIASNILYGIVYAFKTCINFFKDLVLKMETSFKNIGTRLKNKFDSKMKVKFINIKNGKAELKETEVQSFDELQTAVHDSTKTIIDNMSKVQQNSRSTVNRYHEYIKKENNNHYNNESVIMNEMSAEERRNLPTSVFGLPDERKYPLTDAKHVESAIRLFGHCPEDKRKQLANKINVAAKKFNVEISNTCLVSKYLPKATAEEVLTNIDAEAICIKETNCITEEKEFPIQFNDDGDLLIKNYKKIDFNEEYQKAHQKIKTYDKSDSIEGMKYELACLWFLNTILCKEIHENTKLSDEVRSEYIKIRAWVLNDFVKYNKKVVSLDNEFNFSVYYDTTPFSDAHIKIRSSTIKHIKDILKSALKTFQI